MEGDGSPEPLIRWFMKHGSGGVAVAFSGGVDSTLVAAAAEKAIGSSAMAITLMTDFMTPREIVEAVSVARRLGIRHRVLRIRLPQRIRDNPPDRCYRCKRLILGRAKAYAKRAGYALVVDGTNADDLRSGRPGLRAIEEEGVRSPLSELGIGKSGVRKISRTLGLDHGKPSSPCLATRFPVHHRIGGKELEAVARAEDYLRGLGFREVRVRVRDGLAKIEVERERVGELTGKGMRRDVVATLKAMGFREVTLDLTGYVPEDEREEGKR